MFACATSCIFINHALLEKIKKKTRANAQYYEGLQRLFAGFPITITKEGIKEVRKDGQEKKKDGEEKEKKTCMIVRLTAERKQLYGSVIENPGPMKAHLSYSIRLKHTLHSA